MQLPINESGVIVLFAQEAEKHGFEVISIQTQFPDAIIRYQGQDYRVEFEYKALNFKQHGHDPELCDFIICWENDWPKAPLPIIAMIENTWFETDISPLVWMRLQRNYWRQKAINWRRKAKELEEQYRVIVGDNEEKKLPNSVGRPREEIDPEKVNYYIERGPYTISRRIAREELGLGHILHCRYRKAAIEKMQGSEAVW